MDYLAGVLSEETVYQYDPVRVAEFCRALVPNVGDRDKGVKPATTVASSRSVAIAALAGSLVAYAERPIQVPTEPNSPQAASLPASAVVVPFPTQPPVSIGPAAPTAPLAVIEAMGNDDRQLPALLSILNYRLAYIEHTHDSPALAARGRRLVQQLAAIRPGVVATCEPTTELTSPNVQLALRRVGAMTEESGIGDQVLDLLAHFGVMVRVGDRWGIAHPALEMFFAAEHVADNREHWVSLQPQHRRLMRWTAAVLARRADDHRNDQFCQDLGRALRGWSPVSLLDVADVLAQFGHAHTPATLRLQDWLGTQLKELAEVPSGWLRRRLWQCSQELGIDLGLPAPDWPTEPMVPAATLEAERLVTDVPEFLAQLGLSPSLARRSDWYEDRRAIQALLNCLKDGSEGPRQLTAAAWLGQASLQTYVDLVVDGPRIWNTHLATALEVVAEIAANRDLDGTRRAVAFGILATDSHLLELAASDRVDRTLLCTLELMLDKRLFFDLQQSAWLVYS